MKRCIKCEQEKEITEFYANAKCADRHSPTCKVCFRDRAKKVHQQKVKDRAMSRVGHSRKLYLQKIKELK